ncbi:MAG: reverse transcriptase domain-containing protein, partial [Planctomycetota bacterium]
MLTLREVKLLLPRGFYTVSLDLQDGYWHVPIAPAKRPFLGFRYQGTDYWFRALPFGLNIAPRIFTKLITAAVRVISARGIFVLAYLDDILVAAPSASLCADHLRIALEILSNLGWIVNLRKSRLVPSQTFQWLGLQ